jgi:cytochrome c oxidase subunit III
LSDSHAIIADTRRPRPHDPDVPHQFDDMEQKNLSDQLGMWAFLATEVLFFGGLFAALMLYRSLYTQGIHPRPASISDRGIGLFNTFVLLASSYTVVLSVHAAKQGDNNKLFIWLLATMALGMTFLGMKVVRVLQGLQASTSFPTPSISASAPKRRISFTSEADLLPAHPELWQQALASDWDVPTDRRTPGTPKLFMQHAQLFYVFYYTMTMIHAMHMIIGLGIFALLAWRAKKGYYTPRRKHARSKFPAFTGTLSILSGFSCSRCYI